MNKKILEGADLFCGAGGTTEGLKLACEEEGIEINLIAINHWEIAIATHKINHPEVKHYCESLDNVNPRKRVPKGYLDILVASPECVHFSNARGGRPMNDQSRATAWHVLRWAEALNVKNILIENVREFKTWGPLGANGRPLKSKKGQLFDAFINALKAMNYHVEHKILNCADYGDPTTRKRLFILARKGKKVVWPEITHTPEGEGNTLKWKTARSIIDWDIPGKSIFGRKKPLCNNTMRRIMNGLKKFSGPELEPFLIQMYGNSNAASIDKPLPTITKNPKSYLCQPFLVEFYGNGKAQPIDKPLPTQTTKDRFGVVEPFILRITHTGAGDKLVYSADKPLATIVTKEELAIVQPFLLGQQSGATARSTEEPVPTIATAGAISLVMPEIKGHKLDIKFRMLVPRELSNAMSFGDYEFSGNRVDVVRQIGNAVPVNTAKHLCLALLK